MYKVDGTQVAAKVEKINPGGGGGKIYRTWAAAAATNEIEPFLHRGIHIRIHFQLSHFQYGKKKLKKNML